MRKKRFIQLIKHPCSLSSSRSNYGVSEVIGTLLMISIGITLFAGVSLLVYQTTNIFTPEVVDSPSLIGTVDLDNQDVFLHHYGGESIPAYYRIQGTIGDDESFEKTVSEITGGSDWKIGESYVISSSDKSKFQFSESAIQVSVIDPDKNTIIFDSIIQKSSINTLPKIEVLPSESVTATSATLRLRYDYIFSDQVYFDRLVFFKITADEVNPDDWGTTLTDHNDDFDFTVLPNNGHVPPSDPDAGTYSYSTDSAPYPLNPLTTYYVRAFLRYTYEDEDGVDHIEWQRSRNTVSFTTLSHMVGQWHFDETGPFYSIEYAYDTSGYENHGQVYPDEFGFPRVSPHWPTDNIVLGEAAFQCDGYNDYIRVPSDEELAPTSGMTIETWVDPLATTNNVGDLNKIENSVFGDIDLGFVEKDVVNVTDDIYVIACRPDGIHPKGFVVTVQVDENGMIVENPSAPQAYYQSILSFESIHCMNPRIRHVTDNDLDSDGEDEHIFAIVYQSIDAFDDTIMRGKVVTVAICNDGSIYGILNSYLFDEDIQIDTVTYVDECFDPDIIPIEGTTNKLAIAYESTDLNGRIKTISVGDTGIISHIDTFDFRSVGNAIDRKMVQCNITHVHGTADKYVIFYLIKQDDDNNYDARMRTNITIDADGSITASFEYSSIEPLEDCNYPNIIHMADDIYLLIYLGEKDSNRKAVVQPVSISEDSSGVEVDTTPFAQDKIELTDHNYFKDPDIFYIDDDGTTFYYGILHKGSNHYGRMKTVSVDYDPDTPDITLNLIEDYTLIQPWGDPGVLYHMYDPVICYHTSGSDPAIFHRFLVLCQYDTTDDENNAIINSIKIYADGTLADPLIIDWKTIGTLNYEAPRIVHLSQDGGYHFYAMVSTVGPGNAGLLSTFKISDNGLTIDKTYIDSFIFDSYCIAPDILPVETPADYYLIGYHHTEFGTQLLTIEITDTGEITDSSVQYLEIDNGWSEDNYRVDIDHIHHEIYAITYLKWNAATDGDQEIVTFSIDSDDAEPLLTGFTYTSNAFKENPVIAINLQYIGALDTDHDLFLYSACTAGYVEGETLSIHHDGMNITAIEQELILLSGFVFSMPSIITILPVDSDNNVYAIFADYSLFRSTFIGTFYLSANGQEYYPIDFEIYSKYFCAVHHYEDDIFLLVTSHKPDENITVSSLRIGPKGNISRNTFQSVLQIDSFLNYSLSSEVEDYAFNYYQQNSQTGVIVFTGAHDDGMIITISVDSITEKKTIISKEGSYSLSIKQDNLIEASITFEEGNVETLTCNLHEDEGNGDSWNFIVLKWFKDEDTPTNSFIQLLNYWDETGNVELVTQNAGDSELQTLQYFDDTPLLFGGYNGVYDEFIITELALDQPILDAKYQDYLDP